VSWGSFVQLARLTLDIPASHHESRHTCMRTRGATPAHRWRRPVPGVTGEFMARPRGESCAQATGPLTDE